VDVVGHDLQGLDRHPQLGRLLREQGPETMAP
jgi:hypothetical protein